MKIRTRIVLSFALIAGLGFYFLMDHLLKELRPRYLEAVEEVLVDQSQLLAAWLESQMDSDRIPVERLRQAFQILSRRTISAKIYKLHKQSIDEQVYVTDARGKVIFDSQGRDEGKDFSQWLDVYWTLRGKYGARTTRGDPKNPTTSVLHVAAPIRYQGRIVGVLTLRKPTASINFFIQTARPSILIAGTVAALAVILLGGLLSLWITRPLRSLTAYARQVRAGENPPLPKLGHHEVGEMGIALAEMREALEGKAYVEHYVQSLTHELKSPIAAIQGAAEILEEEKNPEQTAHFVKNIRAESARMNQIVERLLELAGLESRRELQSVEAVDLAALLKRVSERFQMPLAAKGLKLSQDLVPKAEIEGERFLLESALGNLLQNAIDFSPPGGRLAWELRAESEQYRLSLRDEGPGIPDYAVTRIFERFYSLPRPATGKKSSGLGLSLVREVLRLHGGEVKLSNLPEGGTVAELTLPKHS